VNPLKAIIVIILVLVLLRIAHAGGSFEWVLTWDCCKVDTEAWNGLTPAEKDGDKTHFYGDCKEWNKEGGM